MYALQISRENSGEDDFLIFKHDTTFNEDEAKKKIAEFLKDSDDSLDEAISKFVSYCDETYNNKPMWLNPYDIRMIWDYEIYEEGNNVGE